MKVIAVIPARYNSSRFPGKPLARILGKPMIVHVLEKTSQALGKDNVYVATDDERIFNTVIENGFRAVMTSSSCSTGTDRLYDFSLKVDADIYINVQGDEPLVNPNDINAAIDLKIKNLDKVVNCMTAMAVNDKNDITIPKVVTNRTNELLYMSRQDIPGKKNKESDDPKYFKQVCIYAFSKEELKDFYEFGKTSEIEIAEDIEILRFLYMGRRVIMLETNSNSIAVDLPEHISKVEQYLSLNGN